MGIYSDYVLNKRKLADQLRQTRNQEGNDLWTKIMQAANFGKDIWSSSRAEQAAKDADARALENAVKLAQEQSGISAGEWAPGQPGTQGMTYPELSGMPPVPGLPGKSEGWRHAVQSASDATESAKAAQAQKDKEALATLGHGWDIEMTTAEDAKRLAEQQASNEFAIEQEKIRHQNAMDEAIAAHNLSEKSATKIQDIANKIQDSIVVNLGMVTPLGSPGWALTDEMKPAALAQAKNLIAMYPDLTHAEAATLKTYFDNLISATAATPTGVATATGTPTDKVKTALDTLKQTFPKEKLAPSVQTFSGGGMEAIGGMRARQSGAEHDLENDIKIIRPLVEKAAKTDAKAKADLGILDEIYTKSIDIAFLPDMDYRIYRSLVNDYLNRYANKPYNPTGG